MICNIYIAWFLPKCFKKIKTKKFSMLDLYVSHVKNCIVCKTLTKKKRSLSVYLFDKTTNFICQKLCANINDFSLVLIHFVMTIHISHTQPSMNLSYVVIGTRLEVTAACIKSIQTKKSKIKYSNILQILRNCNHYSENNMYHKQML